MINNIFFSHLTECNKFYKCSNGRGYLFDCPAGEHWSVHLDRCDYPEFAECNVDGTHQYKLKKVKAKKASDDDVNHDTLEFDIDPRCEGGDPYKPLHFQHPSDCTKFYKCYMGKAYVIKCPRGQHFSQRYNRCEHMSIARCSIVKPAAASMAIPYMDLSQSVIDKQRTIVDDADYMIDDERCEVDDDRYNPIHFSHPSDCQMFYKCFNNRAYKVSCPEGLHFNSKTNACDYPEVAKCKKVLRINAASEVVVPSIPDCSHGQNLNFAVQGSNTRYFECRNGDVFLMECGPKEHFNINTRRCDIDRPNVLQPDFPQRQQLNPQRPVMVPYQPNYYYPNYWGMNWNGNQQYPPMPPNGPVINKDENKVPQAVPNVPQAPLPPLPPPPPPQPQPHIPDFPSWLPQPNQNIGFPDIISPPRNSVPMDDTSVEDFDFSRGKFTSRCENDDDMYHPQHLAHETDCGKFYKCFNGKAFLMTCPEGEEFSEKLQRCDYHEFADCDPIELIKRKIQI